MVIALALFGGLSGRVAAKWLVLTLPVAWLLGTGLGLRWPGPTGSGWMPALSMLLAGLLAAINPHVPTLLPYRRGRWARHGARLPQWPHHGIHRHLVSGRRGNRRGARTGGAASRRLDEFAPRALAEDRRPNPRQLDGCHWSARACLEFASGILSEGMGGMPNFICPDFILKCMLRRMKSCHLPVWSIYPNVLLCSVSGTQTPRPSHSY